MKQEEKFGHTTEETKLSEIIDLYGSDKNLSNYTHAYEHFFRPIKDDIKSILEIGIGTLVPGAKSSMYPVTDRPYKQGASLRAWEHFFPNAKIYGGDIQEDTQFEEGRIKTFLFDSMNTEQCHEQLKDLSFDIIIDDGNHDAIAQIRTFYNLISRVNKGGIYVIEDITPGNSDVVIPHINSAIQTLDLKPYLLNDNKNLLILTKN